MTASIQSGTEQPDDQRPGAFVVVVVATYRRPAELRRLLESLSANAPEVRAVVVVDNGSSLEVKTIVEAWPGAGFYVDPGRNLGCGGGLRLGEETAWQTYAAQLTHLAILDDDAVVTHGAFRELLSAMSATGAEVACATIVESTGVISWLPGLERKEKWIETARLTPKEYAACTDGRTLPFVWAQGICLVATRALIARVGFHESHFWVRGEDLEYSLRLTAQSAGIWVPGAIVQHVPPAGEPAHAGRGEYLKHCAMLQNVIHIGLRLPHGKRIAWTIPSNTLRFLRTWGLTSALDAWRAFWRGAILGEAAGQGVGRTFARRSEG